MPDQIKKFIDEWRCKGIVISDKEAFEVYRHCLRKMKVVKIEDPDSYISLLYPDEIKDYLVRKAVNVATMFRMIGGR